MSFTNNLGFLEQPECLKSLTDLEERLVSPRIPFMQIKALGVGRQSSLHGSVINVPVDVDTMVQSLPREIDQSYTVELELKRKLEFKHYYKKQIIRPAIVFEAAKYLEKQELFKKYNINLSLEWFDDASQTIEKIGTQDLNDDPKSSESENDDDIIFQNGRLEKRNAQLCKETLLANPDLIRIAPGN